MFRSRVLCLESVQGVNTAQAMLALLYVVVHLRCLLEMDWQCGVGGR